MFFLLFPGVAANAACWEHYRDLSIADHIKEYPISESDKWVHYEQVRGGKRYFAVALYGALSKGIEISAPLHYTNKLRPISKLAKDALYAFGGEKIRSLYTYELKVKEKDFEGWVLVQNVLYEPLQKELKKGQEFTGCLVLIGVLREKHLYILNEFSAK